MNLELWGSILGMHGQSDYHSLGLPKARFFYLAAHAMAGKVGQW
jgi:hypothetical protein